MYEWLVELEVIAEKFQYSVNAIIALSTFFAVVVSLWIATRTEKPKLLCKCEFALSVAPSGGCTEFISVSVSNVGRTHAYLPSKFFRLQVPFSKMTFLANKYTHFSGKSGDTKTKLDVGETISVAVFECETIGEEIREHCDKYVQFLGFIRRRMIKGIVYDDLGNKHIAKLHPDAKKKILDNS